MKMRILKQIPAIAGEIEILAFGWGSWGDSGRWFSVSIIYWYIELEWGHD